MTPTLFMMEKVNREVPLCNGNFEQRFELTVTGSKMFYQLSSELVVSHSNNFSVLLKLLKAGLKRTALGLVEHSHFVKESLLA